MSEIDQVGLEAACYAYCKSSGRACYGHDMKAAIRAYEARRETTFDPTAQLGGVIPPPSAMPDDVSETVRWIRSTLDWSPQAQRAADMLECQARDLEGLGRLVDWYQAEHPKGVISTTTTPDPPPD